MLLLTTFNYKTKRETDNKLILLMTIFRTLTYIFLTITLMQSCSKGDNSVSGNFGLAGDKNNVAACSVSFIHAAAGAPSLDLKLDETRLNVLYFNYSDRIKYFNSYVGKHKLSILYPFSNAPLFTYQVDLEEGGIYSVFITDTASKMNAIAIKDNAIYAREDSVKIRFANMSPDAPALSLFVRGSDKPIATNISYKKGSAFVSLVQGNGIQFEIKTSSGNKLLATSAPVNLNNNDSYTVWCGGYLKGNVANNTMIKLNTYAHFH